MSVLILFLRNDCGPIEMIKKASVRLKNSNNLRFPASAHQGVEDAQVCDRELQSTTDGNKGMRTTAITIQVDPVRLRAAGIVWSEKI